MFSRRQILKMMASFPLIGGLASTGLTGKTSGIRHARSRNYFTELGLRPLINGRGVVTTLTGSLMPPEVMGAMNFASRLFMSLIELNEKAGERIACFIHFFITASIFCSSPDHANALTYDMLLKDGHVIDPKKRD